MTLSPAAAPRFASDNVTGAHPDVLAALVAANDGTAASYGDDPWTRRLEPTFSEVFETEVSVIPCMSGTAANSIALSLLAGPADAVLVHERAHVFVDEGTAPEMFTGGARLLPFPGTIGKLDPAALVPALDSLGDLHAAQPAAISVTQATERGSVYSVEEVAAIGAFARANGLRVHMDGARFANALVRLGCSPADMTWRAGVDILSFGATKNGCLAAEALVLFDRNLARGAWVRLKRSGHLLSKMRLISAQLLAYLEQGLWLRNATHANAMAAALGDLLAASPVATVLQPPEANMVFARFPAAVADRLVACGLGGAIDSRGVMRLCTSWQTTTGDLEALAAVLDG